MDSCENCGCRVYSGACVNCNEEIFIAEQYEDLGMDLPEENTDFRKRLDKSEKEQFERLTRIKP